MVAILEVVMRKQERLITIVMPEQYKDYEDFARKTGIEVWHSHTLHYLFNLIRQVKGHLQENKPVLAYNLMDNIEKEMKEKIDENGKMVEVPR
jgi:hypothetical protein